MAIANKIIFGDNLDVTDQGGGVIRVDGTGSSSSGNVVIADPASVIVDETTYDNPVTGSGKINTIVFPLDTVWLSVALEGDVFPRWMIASDPTDGIYMGDGTFNPYNAGSNFYSHNGSGGDNGLSIYAAGNLNLNVDDLLQLNTTSIIATRCTQEPDDSIIGPEMFALWLDPTIGNPSLKIKAQDSNGEFFTATIPMTPR